MSEAGAVSLYLQLERGEKADLEVVARASLAWAAAIREIAAALDPMSDVRVELTSGTEGSLSLNSVVRFVRGAAPKRAQLKAIVLGILMWMGEKGSDWTYQKVLDAITTGKHVEATKGMTHEQINDLAHQIVFVLNPRVAEQPKRQVFLELERDQAVRGVGATDEPGSVPDNIIPRTEFAERAGQAEAPVDEDGRKRTVTVELRVILVSPVLKDAERSWRFQPAALPEFGAVMKDHDFLEGMKLGRIAVPLRPGIEMKIELQSKEELVDGVWAIKERSVTKVLSPGSGHERLPLPTE